MEVEITESRARLLHDTDNRLSHRIIISKRMNRAALGQQNHGRAVAMHPPLTVTR